MVRLTQIPNRFLGMAVLLLSFVGVYSLRNSTSDCLIAAAFGLFGFVLKRLSLPVVPIILGMVLGGIMEVKLRSSMNRVKEPFDFIDRPIAFILFALIVVVLLVQAARALRQARERRERRESRRRSPARFAAHLSGKRERLEGRRRKNRRAARRRFQVRDHF